MRVDADWCGQCYTDLRPPAPPVVQAPTVSAPPPGYGVPAADPLQGPLEQLLPTVPYSPLPDSALPDPPVGRHAAPAAPAAPATPVGEPSWPCLTCQARNPLSASACSECGSTFLAAVAQQDRAALVLPLVGDLTAMSRGRRLGLAGALVAALLVPLALITLLLTGRPADTGGGTPGPSGGNGTVPQAPVVPGDSTGTVPQPGSDTGAAAN